MNRPTTLIALSTLPLLALISACNDKAGTTAAPSAPVAAKAPPAGSDWTTTVVATADGGFLMGNPDAPIKLVEYGSLTCPHCAHFSEQSAEALKSKYVATGKMSYEFRSYLLHGQDLAATMIMQCGGPAPFFTLLEQAYADQANWLGKLVALPAAEQTAMAALPVDQQNIQIAHKSGLYDFAIARGLSTSQIDRCLNDQAFADKMLKVRDRANTEFHLEGTPTFIINGQTVPDVSSWDLLEPKLKAAGA